MTRGDTDAGEVVLTVHVQPRARTTECLGWHGDAVKLRLKAPPVDGAANDELVRFLAGRLRVARDAIHIITGAAGRRKRIGIRGITRAEVLALLGLPDPWPTFPPRKRPFRL